MRTEDNFGERINKFLARHALGSRRTADRLIAEGRVEVNGVVLRQAGAKVHRGDQIKVDGRTVEEVPGQMYLAFHKPAGYLTTMADPAGRPAVKELLPECPGLHPVGRLDLDTEGLLIATTDGALTNRLTHPRYGHQKEYRVWCDPQPDSSTVSRLLAGVELDDGFARADRARLAGTSVILVIRQGRKRQVRRMLAAAGHEVRRLLRIRVGPVRLGDLRSGRWRELTAIELRRLGVLDAPATPV